MHQFSRHVQYKDLFPRIHPLDFLLVLKNKFYHNTSTFKSLHRLLIQQRIHFKIILLVFKALHCLAPQHMSDLLIHQTPVRLLKASDFLVLTRIRSETGVGAFSCSVCKALAIELLLRDIDSEWEERKSVNQRNKTLFSKYFTVVTFSRNKHPHAAVKTLN